MELLGTEGTGANAGFSFCLVFPVTILQINGLICKFYFADDVMPGTYCEIDLDKEKRDAFVYAIKNHYWYQMYIDDLPIWGKYPWLQSRISSKQGVKVTVPDHDGNVFLIFAPE